MKLCRIQNSSAALGRLRAGLMALMLLVCVGGVSAQSADAPVRESAISGGHNQQTEPIKHKTMATTKFKGDPVNLAGDFIAAGSVAPDFQLVKSDLSKCSLKDFKGKKVLLNIFPSLDTGVCATSVRKFNKEAASLQNTVVLCISKDLPFAHRRFCTTEGIENVVTLSDFTCSSFGADYGVSMTDGPLAGLFARSVVVINEDGKVVYSELVPEITQEPDYVSAMKAVK